MCLGALKNYYASSGSTPLHYAASSGQLDIITRLVHKGIGVNQMSSGSVACTALYCAASSGSLDAVDLLLDFGAEVDTVCANECTALHIASSNGHDAIVERLIQAGAEVDYQATNGIAAIHNAVNNARFKTTERLIAADCDLDIQNSAGNTPLHIAACKGNVEIARLLLNANCEINIKNSKGHQAIHSAASNGFFDVVLLLVQHGAPWRLKGDLDVAKMLCRKSNLMASYVDGRLRIAERAKHRKAKPTDAFESMPSEEEMKQKQAQADAFMAELLAEEEQEKKQGDRKERNKKNRDKRKKNQAVESKMDVEKSNASHTQPNKEEESMKTAHTANAATMDEKQKAMDVHDDFPRVILKGRNRIAMESASPAPEPKLKPKETTSNRQKKREQQKQRKNRQPAPRLPDSVEGASRSSGEPEQSIKIESQTDPKSDDMAPIQPPVPSKNTSITVIRRRSSTHPVVVKTIPEPKKPPPSQPPVPKELPVQQGKPSKKTMAYLSRSVSVPGPKAPEKTVRHAPHRSLTMADVVAGHSKKSDGPSDPELPGKDETVPSPPKAPMGHVWADAVKSTLDKKPETKIEVLKKRGSVRSATSKVHVVNVSSNKKAFLPFTEGMVDRSPVWLNKPLGVVSNHGSDTSTDAMTSERTIERSDDKDRDDSEERKEPVLKWATKEFPAAESPSTELKGTRMAPLTQKMKDLLLESPKESPNAPTVEEAEMKSEKSGNASEHPLQWSSPPDQLNTSIPSISLKADVKTDTGWAPSHQESAWSETRFPPLPTDHTTSTASTGYPFPGRSADWNVKEFDVYGNSDGPVALSSSQSWSYTEPTPTSTGPSGDPLHGEEASFRDRPFIFQSIDQMDPDSLLPPELKEEITNGGATSNRFRTKSSVSSRGSPTSNQSPNAKAMHYPSQGSPTWTKNAQGPYFTPRVHPPPPPPQPQPQLQPVLSENNTILSRIPDDPWGIDEVDVASLRIPEPPQTPTYVPTHRPSHSLPLRPPQPPPPDVYPYEERLPYICPYSRAPMPLTADGIPYDRSVQGGPGYYHPYVPYSNGYM